MILTFIPQFLRYWTMIITVNNHMIYNNVHSLYSCTCVYTFELVKLQETFEER